MYLLKLALICIELYFKSYTKNIMDKKIYKRKKSLKQTRDALIKIKNSVPKIIFRAKNTIITLRNKSQISRWLEIYPEGKYTINY